MEAVYIQYGMCVLYFNIIKLSTVNTDPFNSYCVFLRKNFVLRYLRMA
jgi:hypothetical protein